MASGKSLELAEIQRPEPEVLCAVCRRPWSSHLRKKDNEVMKKYQGHYPTRSGYGRKLRPKKGWLKKGMMHRKKPPSSLHLSIMSEKMRNDG